MFIDITGIDKAELLAELFNNAAPKGMGFLSASATRHMGVEEAKEILKEQTYFDYLEGRSFKLDFAETKEFRVDLYDRDNGRGKSKEIIDKLKSTQSPTQTTS